MNPQPMAGSSGPVTSGPVIGHIQNRPASVSLVPRHTTDLCAKGLGLCRHADSGKDLLADRLDDKTRPNRSWCIKAVKDGDPMPAVSQQCRGGKPADPGPCDGYGHGPCHVQVIAKDAGQGNGL